ncbi:hypothetical protein [Pseudocolwellia sp. HL-MZ7]|uniref:hypothetical protein n=1 Tax=Pseudocolwellia sp. HL-MZ7 TaxID=3400627 RepID=UPI003CFA4446
MGCDQINKDDIATDKKQITYSTDIQMLAKLINLDELDVSEVNWATGMIDRGDSYLTDEFTNDWWLTALITLKSHQQVISLQENCKLLHILTELDDKLISNVSKTLTNNSTFISTVPMQVYDACRFKTDVLANGSLLIDSKTNKVFVELYVN